MWLIVSLIVIIIFLIWYSSSPFYWKRRGIPYLVPLPIFGNYLPVLTMGVNKFNKSLNEKFMGQPFYGFHMFTRPALYVKDADLIQRILGTDFEYFTSHGMYANQDRDLTGGNLFHTHGQQWKEMRSQLSQYFTPAKVKAMLLYADNVIDKAMDIIDNNIKNNKPTELEYIMTNITIDVITKAVFGVESNAFINKRTIFNELAKDMFKANVTSKIFLSIISPRLYEWLKLNIFPKQCTETIVAIVRKAVEYRKKENINNMNDYLEGMLEMVENNSTSVSQEKYFPDGTRVPSHDLNTLISQAILLFGAGVETSALVMTFFFLEMALHPDIQDRCRTEINSALKDTGRQIITVADLSKLNYLGAAIQETMRLYPPLSMLNRECTKDYQIPGTNINIEKGTFVMMSSLGTHMDPKYFPNPQLFIPERFMNGSKIKNGSYYPFGMGPRTCLGMGLANSEMKLVTSRLLHRYEFSVCSKTDVPAKYKKYNVLTIPVNGMWLNVRPITTSLL